MAMTPQYNDRRKQLREDDLYVVTSDRASLRERDHEGGTAWTYTTHDLDPGDIIRYTGKRGGIGHDNVDIDTFEVVISERAQEGVRGNFVPNSWGRADQSTFRHLGEILEERVNAAVEHERRAIERARALTRARMEVLAQEGNQDDRINVELTGDSNQ